MSVLVIKNISSTIFSNPLLNDIGIALPIGGYDWIRPSEFLAWCTSSFGGDAESEITLGKLIVNIDTADVSATSGIMALQTYYGQNVTPTIQEYNRTSLLMLHNGTLSNNELVGRSSLLSDKKYIFPFPFRITELAWNNSHNASFDLLFYRYYFNGSGYAGNPFWTYQARNIQYDYVKSLSYNFVEGDYLQIIYRDRGTNASDFEGDLWGGKL